MPRVDVHETDKEFILDVEVPGMEKKDVKIALKTMYLLYLVNVNKKRKLRRKSILEWKGIIVNLYAHSVFLKTWMQTKYQLNTIKAY